MIMSRGVRVQIDLPSNEGAREALELLQPVYNAFEGEVSFADIIVLAGSVALEKAGGPRVPFCPGRVDATDGESAQDLSPRTYYLDPLTAALDSARVRLFIHWLLKFKVKQVRVKHLLGFSFCVIQHAFGCLCLTHM